MKVLIDYPQSRLPGTFEAFSVMTLAAGAIFIPLSLTTNVPLPHSFLRVFGGACPLCGGTRAVTSLMLGHVETAIRYNPLALVIFVMMLYSAASYLLLVLPFGRRPVLYSTPRESILLKGLIISAFIANWAYVLWSGMYMVPLPK